MSLGRSYARALLESAKSPKERDDSRKALSSLVELLEGSKELRVALYSPALSTQEQTAVIDSLANKLQLSKLTVDFLHLLARKGRLSALPQIQTNLEEVAAEQDGMALGTVVSAEDLKSEDLKTLTEAFTKKLGKKVVFHQSKDASLLAGLKVTVNGVTYDGTLRAQLERMKRELSQGGVTH